MKHTPITGKVFKLDISEELKVPITAYAVDPDGSIVEKQRIDGEGNFKFEGKNLDRASLLIAPEQEGRATPKSLADLEKLDPYRPVLKRQFDRKDVGILAIPDPILHAWYLCFCRVRGRVEREFCFKLPIFLGGQNICFTLPVCTARVHVCRVKPKIFKLVDKDIFRLRDQFVKLPLTKPRFPFPPPPPPDPLAEIASSQVRSLKAIPTYETGIFSQELIFKLQSDSPALLREAFSTHLYEIRPLLPYLDICSWFYYTEEILVAEVGENGYFDEGFWHLCGADEDIYFWVEYLFDGKWVPVYQPSLCAGTYWNYVCGTSVTLKVTDPRVIGCRPLRGRFMELIRVGSNAFVPLINTNTGFVHSLGSGVGFDDSPSTHDNHTFERPFGQTLPIFADFGVELPDPATATHYRVSWKPIADSDIEANWNILENPINRAYVDNVQGADLITRPVNGSFLLNDPAHSGFYKIPQDNPLNQVEIPVPAAPQVLLDRDWKDGPEFKIAEWVTNTSKEITTKTIPPGVYHLRIELCREVGGILQPASVRREIFQMPTLASNFLVGDLADEPHLYGYNSVDGSARGFLLTLAIDNRSCTSSIDNAQVNGNPADPNCGLLFADLASKNTGRLGFSAAHPANKGTFYFDMVRGNNQITGLTDVPTNGVLGDNPAVNNYALSGDNYSRNNFDVDAWLAAGSCAQGAAFSETLSVKAMATDGSNRLGLYDAAQRVAAFAVVQECDCAEG